MKRRSFLRKGAITTAGLGLALGGYSYLVEPFWTEIVHHDMPIHNLPAHLVGKRVMQISDLHVGRRFDPAYLVKALKRAKLENPDIVVYTGDYVTYDDAHQYRQLDAVLPHFVHGSLATLAILGNHDYGHGWQQNDVAERIVHQLDAHAIKTLRNEVLDVDGLHVVGLDDLWAGRLDATGVIPQISHSTPALTLCHNPDACDLDIWEDYQGWILAGHTHGGQVAPPFLDPPLLPVQNKRYSAGKIVLDDRRTLYINRALGHLWQVRFNVRPEITVFTLTTA